MKEKSRYVTEIFFLALVNISVECDSFFSNPFRVFEETPTFFKIFFVLSCIGTKMFEVLPFTLFCKGIKSGLKFFDFCSPVVLLLFCCCFVVLFCCVCVFCFWVNWRKSNFFFLSESLKFCNAPSSWDISSELEAWTFFLEKKEACSESQFLSNLALSLFFCCY